MVRLVLTCKETEFLDLLYRNYYNSLKLYAYAVLEKRYEYWPLAEDCVQRTFETAIIKMNVINIFYFRWPF